MAVATGTAILGAAALSAGVGAAGSAMAGKAQSKAAKSAASNERQMFEETQLANEVGYNRGVDSLSDSLRLGTADVRNGYAQGNNVLRDYSGRAFQDANRGYTQAAATLDHYDNFAPQATNQLAALAGVNGSAAQANALKNDPGYQFRLNQGVQALDRGAAARGALNSGAQQKALMQYGQGLASEELNNAFARVGDVQARGYNAAAARSDIFGNRGNALANINSNVGTNLANNAVGMGTNLGNMQQQYGTGRANLAVGQASQNQNLSMNTANALTGLTVGAGNARAGAYEGMASSVNAGIQNGLTAYGMSQQNPGMYQNNYGTIGGRLYNGPR